MFLTIQEAAHYSGLSTVTIRRYVHDGTLKGYRKGKQLIIIDVADLDNLVKPLA